MVEPGEYFNKLKADCTKCFGICCVALYFSASEGFPRDKEPGQACQHLQEDSRCQIYSDLKDRGLKGCMGFDCFGAGQQVSRVSFAGVDWRQALEIASAMFAVFLVMRQIHEMMWYLQGALHQPAASPIQTELQSILGETEGLTYLTTGELLKLDIVAHRARVNSLLVRTSELVRGEIASSNSQKGKNLQLRKRLMGSDLRKNDFRGANLRGACLIAADLRGTDLSGADLLGVDFRDTDIRGTDLSRGLFLTQAQINVARGDHTTRLPDVLDYPRSWQ